jgi:hypothetical protein
MRPVQKLCLGSLRDEDGVGLLITLIALAIFGTLALFTSMRSVTEVRISDNYESRVQAKQAALAGINHARELLRGCDFNDFLKGPDGTYTNTSSYLVVARSMAARNPVTWALARSMNIDNPTSSVQNLADDGLLNTGKYGTTNGIILIPSAGIAQTAPNPYVGGTIVTSRYFVKITDNNGEASELARDGADNPFVDGDHIIIVRSMGISRTIREEGGGTVRANSVAVFEARFQRTNTWDIDAPLIVEGDDVLPSAPNMFDGNSFLLDGGHASYGIATIDTDRNSGSPLPNQIAGHLDINQQNNVQGLGGSPSISDITGNLTSPDQLLLLDPNYLHRFVTQEIPLIADAVFQGDQHWAGGSAPDIGSYDIRNPPNDPSQHPRVTYVDGDLDVQGNLEGGGLLVIRGKLTGGGSFNFNGLIMVLGQGEIDLSGLNMGVNGGIFVANLTESNGTISFGTPRLTMAGNSDIHVHSDALRIARELLPLRQLGLREVTSRTDP